MISRNFRTVCIALSSALIITSFAGCASADKYADIDPIGSGSEAGNSITTLYAPDGRTAEVPENELSEYIANGWHTTAPDIAKTGYYLASPASEADFINFLNTYATDIDNLLFEFSLGLAFEYDFKEIQGPEHPYAYDDVYIWNKVTEPGIKSLADVKASFYNTFSKDSVNTDYFFKCYAEFNGCVHRACADGIGGFIPTSYKFSDVEYISDTEVKISGISFMDYDVDGKISEDEKEDVSDTEMVMVLEDGKWKYRLD